MKRFVLIAGILLGGCGGLFAGDDATQFWQTVGFDWHPVPGLKLELTKQLRYEDTFAAVESDITEVGASWRVKEWLAVRADYRFVGLGEEKRNRLDGNVILHWRFPAFTVSNRARLQQEFVQTTRDDWSELAFRDRVRLTFLPDRDFRPFAGGEIFVGLDEEGKSENKYRLTGGFDYRLSKRVVLTLFYHYQRDMGEKTNETRHIIAGEFHYSF